MRQMDSDLRIEEMMEGEMMEGGVVVTRELEEKQNEGHDKVSSVGREAEEAITVECLEASILCQKEGCSSPAPSPLASCLPRKS